MPAGWPKGESLDWTSGTGGSEEQPAAPIAQDVY